MSRDRANIKVGREFYEKHNERRKELGLTWEKYIAGESPEIEDTIRRVTREELEDDRPHELDTLDEDDIRQIIRNELEVLRRELRH
jgi:hypothetical protein